jgi:hypothetical protein
MTRRQIAVLVVWLWAAEASVAPVKGRAQTAPAAVTRAASQPAGITPSQGSPAAAAVPNTLQVAALNYVQYPSLNPVSALTLTVGEPGTNIYDIVHDRVGKTTWSCASPQFYKVAVVDSSLKIVHRVTVTAVRLIGFGPDGSRYTTCDGKGHPTRLDLILGSQINTGDLVQVFVYDEAAQTKLLITSNGKLAISTSPVVAVTATPQAAPGEALNNGKKRTVGQLNFAFADTNLVHKSPVNVYARSTDLLSTDGKDTKSSVAVTAGAQYGVFHSWYSPVSLAQTLQGHQSAKNLSAVTSLGFNTLPPWRWTSSFLTNSIILAPLPPEPSVANLYTHRFEQLASAKTPLLAVNDYSLNGSFSWSTISFPFTCRLLFWDRSGARRSAAAAKTAAADTKAAAAAQTPTCLGTEIDLGGWYLPLDVTKHGTRKAEGYGDVSILVPLSDFSVASKELTYVTKTDPTKFQLRIKYTDAINPSNNYARTRGWTFGIEALK